MSSEQSRLLDVNVLLALAITTHVHHAAAHRALRSLESWWTCPLTESALIRLLLNPVVAGRAFTIGDVLAVLRGMRSHRTWSFLVDDSSPAQPVIDVGVIASHRHVTDLHLLDLAARHGGLLATFDASLEAVISPVDRKHLEVLPTA